ncbi:hypothetical protein T492DRAFT_515866 [Pavlovales sp. CCMP2436]|nr:hypothetical protein T492DRAFT_515866 [Pavlovales sp. CCMP2436]
MEEKSEAHHFEDSGDEADDASDNSDLAREKQRARQANGWSKKSRDLYVGGLLKFGPTRLRHIELATPTPGHEGTCFGKPLDEQRAIASGFAALCLKSMGKTIADYPWAPRVVDPSATTDLTDGVLREQNFLGKVSRNAASYLEKMQMAYDLHELVRKHLGGDEAGGAVADEPPVFAREGMLAFRMARGASAEEAAAVEAAEDQAAAAAEPTDDEAAIKAEDDAKVLYTQRVRRLAQLKVPVGAPARTAPCASWGSSEDRMLLLGIWLYGLNGYESLRRDNLLGTLARLHLFDTEDAPDGRPAGDVPPGAVPWPSRDALDRRFHALMRVWTAGSSAGEGGGAKLKAEPSARKASAPRPKAEPKPKAAPKPKPGVASGTPDSLGPRNAAKAARARLADDSDDDFEPYARKVKLAPAAKQPAPSKATATKPAPAPKPTGPPPDPELKKAVTAAMLKYGALNDDASGHGRSLADAVEMEHGKPPPADGVELRRIVVVVRVEWEAQSQSDDKDKAKRAQGKLTRLKLCDAVRKLARSPPHAALPVAKEEGLPSWWTAPAHDHALLRGSARHGFAMFEAVFADRELFPDLPPATPPPNQALKESLFRRIRKIQLAAEKRPGPAAAGKASNGVGGSAAPPRPKAAATRAPAAAAKPASAPARDGGNGNGSQSAPVAAPPKKQFARDWGGARPAGAGPLPVQTPAPAPGNKRPAEPPTDKLPFKKQHNLESR